MTTIGVGIIVHKEESIKDCVESIEPYVDQIVVATQEDTPDKIAMLAKVSDKVEVHNFGKWQDDFAMKRNFCFSKLNTDFLFWLDSDDIIHEPENLRFLVENAKPEDGAVWLPYHYAVDDCGNPSTIYERERLMRAKQGWVWRGRLHETCEPLIPCKFTRHDTPIILHRFRHLGDSRGERNFSLLHMMLKEDPENRRIWLYLGHQHFAGGMYFEAAKWYLKFGQDTQAMPLERYQALCYASKAMRFIGDKQCIDISLMAVEQFPNYIDGYCEVAQSYGAFGMFEKALHWAKLADVKDPLIQQPPALIFINPLDTGFNRYMLMVECYIRNGRIEEAVEYTKRAYKIRPVQEVAQKIGSLLSMEFNDKLESSIKTIAVALERTGEVHRLKKLKEAIPFQIRDSNFYKEFITKVPQYYEGIKDETGFDEVNKNKVLINLSKCLNPDLALKEADKKYKHVEIIAPKPSPETSGWLNAFSQYDMEELVASSERRIKNLRNEDGRIVCEYDVANLPISMARMYLGQGFEHWNPGTMEKQGIGGSELAAATVCKEMAKRNWLPILYAMDNQVWDGVLYRHHSTFIPEQANCNLFISSRAPRVFQKDIPALQKWLWVHDIYLIDPLLPELVEQIDVIICLTKWHVGHMKRVYPMLKDAEVWDFDRFKLTYDDTWTATTYEDVKLSHVPKLAIIGNGIDITRFKRMPKKRFENRFIWMSSPDRGLLEVLELWPKIRKVIKNAELKIYYGWNYFDATLMFPRQRELKAKIKNLLNQGGIEWCGRVGQKQIAHELMQAGCILYPPHDFRETYGIAFLEAQAAGVICFYRQNGALGETIKHGVPIPMDAKQDDIISIIQNTLQDKAGCATLRAKAREFALKRTWFSQTTKFLKCYQRIEEVGDDHKDRFNQKRGEVSS